MKDGSRKTVSKETRMKISASRKKYLRENPDKHIWKRADKFKSSPCEKVKEYLRNKNIKFVEEWQPLKDRFFSVDIAFPDIMLAVEINGNQHYNSDGTLGEYYQERHDLIEAAGWKVIELHYSIAYSDALESLETILNIQEQPDYSEYIAQMKSKRAAKPKALPRGEKLMASNDLKWGPFIDKVKNSNIDFGKLGLANKVSKILNITPQKVRKWMLRNMPEFYEDRCYKRKRPAFLSMVF
jgi:very-short-patch-repair endonuclease